MVSVKWGDVLSMLLPGSLALFAVSLFFGTPDWTIRAIGNLGPTSGVVVLIAAAQGRGKP